MNSQKTVRLLMQICSIQSLVLPSGKGHMQKSTSCNLWLSTNLWLSRREVGKDKMKVDRTNCLQEGQVVKFSRRVTKSFFY